MPTARSLPHDWFPGVLPANVEIGEGSWLYSAFAFLHYASRRPTGLRIGRRTGVYIDTLFDIGPGGEVEVGDHCTLAGPIFSTRARVEIGDRVLISSRVLIADDAFAAPPAVVGPTDPIEPPRTVISVGDDAWIGTGAVLLAGARIGTGAVVGAGTVVDFDIPDLAVVAGDPPRVVGRAG